MLLRRTKAPEVLLQKENQEGLPVLVQFIKEGLVKAKLSADIKSEKKEKKKEKTDKDGRKKEKKQKDDDTDEKKEKGNTSVAYQVRGCEQMNIVFRYI